MAKKKDNHLMALWSERITMMLVLGFLGIICSIPLITAGASMTAMHRSMMMYVTEDDKKVFKNYFEGFKMHFKQSTLIWIINFVMILLFCFDLLFYGGSDNWILTAGMIVVTISLMILVFEMTMSFVIVASGHAKGVKDTILMALNFALKCPYEALMMLVLNLAIPGVLFLFMLPVLVFAPGILSYLSWQFLPKAFEKYKENAYK